jgi:hypothetical protein
MGLSGKVEATPSIASALNTGVGSEGQEQGVLTRRIPKGVEACHMPHGCGLDNRERSLNL